MMVNISRKIETIDLFLESLKRNDNFPFAIPFYFCPDHNKSCSKHHGEIVISSYNTVTEKFHLQYYGVHMLEINFEYDQPHEFVSGLIQDALNSRKRLLKLRDLKKYIDPELIMPRKITVNFRLAPREYEEAKMKSKQDGITLSDFFRSSVLNVLH